MAFSLGSASVSSEINVTPLIDVLLVLLIIFMVVVPLTPRGLNSQVPQTPSGDASPEPVSVRVLAGAAAGEVRYELDGEPVAAADLALNLRRRLALRSGRSVWVAASPAVSYRAVAEVVSEAKSAGAVTAGAEAPIGGWWGSPA